MTSHEFCHRELEIVSDETIVYWNCCMREVCALKLDSSPIEIGGKGTHVEIDESMFVRRKSNVGRLVREQWVFGGICRETKECFIVSVQIVPEKLCLQRSAGSSGLKQKSSVTAGLLTLGFLIFQTNFTHIAL